MDGDLLVSPVEHRRHGDVARVLQLAEAVLDLPLRAISDDVTRDFRISS